MGSPVSNVNYVIVSVPLAALGTPATKYAMCPVTGTVVWCGYASDVAVDATNVLTSDINGTAITGGAITTAAATTVAGTGLQANPSAANAVKRGDRLGVATDGGGTVGSGMFTFLIEQI